MRTTRLVGLSVRAVGRYKLRSGFMMLGSLVGVAALTLVVSIGQGVQAKFLTMVRQVLGDSAVLIVGGGNRLHGSPRGDVARLTVDDIAAIAKQVPEVRAWDPAHHTRVAVSSPLERPIGNLGDPPTAPALANHAT